MLFDEPLANLDPATGKTALKHAGCKVTSDTHPMHIDSMDISDLSVKERGERIGLVMQNPNQMITHDMHLMLEYTDRAVVIADGVLLADTTPAQVLTDESVSAKPLKAGDYGVIAFAILFCTIALFITFKDGSRFYNPFN